MPVSPPSPGVDIEEMPSGPRTITGVATSVTAFVGTALRGPVDETIRCTSWSDFERTYGGLWAESDLGYSVFQFFLNGGAQAVISRVPAGATEAEYAAAIDRLDGADLVNLLCIPPTDRNTPTSTRTWATALTWCERRRAILLVDPPEAWGDARAAADLAGGFDSLRSPNSAFYFPRILCPDPLQQSMPRPFAPSGAIAGVIARTDAQRGVWKAPAGTGATLAGVTQLEFEITESDSDLLSPRGVNALRDMSELGPVVWGARTGRGDDAMADEWKYLPVRRFALYLEESVSRGLRWAVFEPNDEPLWAQIRLSVGAFMRDLFRQGAFQGTTPRDAFLVGCDATTTTPADIDGGFVNVVLGFAPLKPAEFVILELRQLAGHLPPPP